MDPRSTRLSVNVNKLATLRNARGSNRPDLFTFARKILDYGAAGITVHPRPDGRHVRHDDVRDLAKLVADFNRPAEFNVEGYPDENFLSLIEEVRPDQATLVPDPPDAITSNAGWNLESQEDLLMRVLERLGKMNLRASLFVDPQTFSRYQREALERLKPPRVELYTERFAKSFGKPGAETVLSNYVETSKSILALGIGLNAGHDLDQTNLGALVRAIPEIEEVSIGHALICEALEQGMENTIRAYLKILETHHK